MIVASFRTPLIRALLSVTIHLFLPPRAVLSLPPGEVVLSPRRRSRADFHLLSASFRRPNCLLPPELPLLKTLPTATSSFPPPPP